MGTRSAESILSLEIKMGRTIAIVGAGEDIDLAIADRFGREGFQVALLARNLEKTSALVDRLAHQGITAKGTRRTSLIATA